VDFYHVLVRFATSRFFDAGATPQKLVDAFRRELDLFGIRPVRGDDYEGLLDRLLSSKFTHISELYPELAYQDCPAWDARIRPYAPDPALLSQAEELFELAKPCPAFEGDDLDNIRSDPWDRLYELGKPALLVYCGNHAQAIGVSTPIERGEVIRCFFGTLYDRVSRVAELPDFPELLRSLRVPPDDWPPAGQAPFGLLKHFSQAIGSQDRKFQVEDPHAWWHQNEATIPDLSGQPPL